MEPANPIPPAHAVPPAVGAALPIDAIDRIRAAWAEVRPDVDTAPAGTIGRIQRAAHHVRAQSDEVLQRFGIGRGEFDVLSAVRRSPVPLTPSDVARQLLASNAAITKRMVQLEASGLAERSRSATDGRVVQVSLTAAGIDCVDAALPATLDFERSIEAVLDAGERVVLESLLRRILNELESRA